MIPNLSLIGNGCRRIGLPRSLTIQSPTYLEGIPMLLDLSRDTHFDPSRIPNRYPRTIRTRREAIPQTPVAVYWNDVLNAMPKAALDIMEPHLKRMRVTKDEYLFQQDDSLEFVYFPETAIVSELHLLEDGRMVEVAMTGKEGVIGIPSLYNADNVPNCVQVIQAGTVLRIESEKLRELSRILPQLPGLLYGTLEQYIRQISQKAVCNMYHSVEQRFCTWLLMFQDRSTNDILRLTHEQIARTLGVYRPSVTCIALEMRKRRLIEYSRGGISIQDRPNMVRTACPCYADMETK